MTYKEAREILTNFHEWMTPDSGVKLRYTHLLRLEALHIAISLIGQAMEGKYESDADKKIERIKQLLW